ncbi:MAG: pseudouridine synthase [Desulfococcaceae bacterium]
MKEDNGMRLQKFLSAAGLCSRRRGEEWILSGRIRVNSQVVKVLGSKIDPEHDRVECDGKPVQIGEDLIYIALNKPAGYVSTCEQPGEKTVLDLIDIPQRVYPVGRLDRESTGLLLLTNDGDLHLRLSHPSFDHEKEYEVITGRAISDEALQRMEKGLLLDGTITRPAKIQKLSPNSFRIILQEGRNRQIRRMVRKVGGHVTGLKRIRMSGIHLGNLPEGAWRHLTEKEKKGLSAAG